MTSPNHDATIIRSEERLLASTTAVPVQRAVLRKVIVTEERTITVTVRHEEFRLDHEPITPGAPSVPPVAMPIELVLHEERITLERTVIPVERVRVDVRAVVEQRDVTDTVRAERVDVDEVPAGDPADADTAVARHRA